MLNVAPRPGTWRPKRSASRIICVPWWTSTRVRSPPPQAMTGEQSSIGVGCAPGEERDSAISICAVHSTTVTAAIAEFCEGTVEKQKTLTEVLDGLVDLTTRLASLATARRSAIVAGVVITATAVEYRLRTTLIDHLGATPWEMVFGTAPRRPGDGTRNGVRHGRSLRLEALFGGKVQGPPRHQALVGVRFADCGCAAAPAAVQRTPECAGCTGRHAGRKGR